MTGREFEDGWIELDGLRFHYTEWGPPAAPPVVMLHGLNVQCHTWDPIARELAGNFHIICMDMRGHGDSDWARSGYRVRSMARDVHGLIDALGLGPVRLVGHSAGVRVAIAVAAERPETVLRLALSDAGPANSKSGAVAMLEFIRATTNLRGFRSEEEARAFYLGFHPEWREDFIDLHVQHQLRRNWAGKLVPKADPDIQWITGSVSLPDVAYLWECAAKLSMPTLLMVGRRSNVLDEEVVEKMLAAMPNSAVRWFDTGHYVPRERPQEFTEVLDDFLKQSLLPRKGTAEMALHPAELGRFFEDFVVGDVYQHALGRTISEADCTWFTLLTCNTNQNHFNAHLARTNPVSGGRVIVNSGLTVALVLGLSVMDMSQNAVANLGWTDIRLVHPVYIGDTIYAESLCTDKRTSSSRPGMGILTMDTRGLNQDGDVIVTWSRSVMVPQRDSGIGQNYFPEAKSGPLALEETAS